MRFENIVLGASMVALFACFVGLIYFAVQEGKRWEAFKQSHGCKVVAHIDGSFFNTFGMSSSGKPVVGIASTPSKTGWLCDDGVTYYK
jgi:hypothetical protein